MIYKHFVSWGLVALLCIAGCDNGSSDNGSDDNSSDDGSSNGGGSTDGGSAGDTTTDPCGPDATPVSMTNKSSSQYGSIYFMTAQNIGFTSLKTTLTVPKRPSTSTSQGTLFLWPGLEPGRGSSITNLGVLQPVLTWGASCASSTVPKDTWWISCMYVTGMGVCSEGDSMTVAVGDKLDIEMWLDGTMWKQKATNRSNGKSVTFDIDLGGAIQYWALFAIEEPSQGVKPSEDIVFTDTVMKLAKSTPSACAPSDVGPTDWLSTPRVSKDGKTCCVSKMILRSQGVPATSPNSL